MNREIKFRAWDKVNKVMVKVVEIDFFRRRMYFTIDNKYYGECSLDDVILMQYTGLKDINGKEIYEGDILIQNNNKADLVQVCFGEFGIRSLKTEKVIDKSVGWYLKVLPTDVISKVAPFCYDTPINNYWIERLNTKIIGNIYENPELLEVGQ